MSGVEFDLDGVLAEALYKGPTVRAEQLVGVDACLRQLAGQLALIERPELGERFGVVPSGTLFIGAPGTGKTLLARYLANQLGIPLYQLTADQFGSDPERIHRVFRRLARERAVLFIDEISILCQRRDWASSEERRMLAALLTELDGLSSLALQERLWVIGACTPDISLDSAIQRSGRLGVTVEFALPSEEQRAQLLRLYLAPVPRRVSAEDINRLAEMSGGATGADVRDYVSQAASLVLGELRDESDPVIEYRHLEVVFGRRGFVAAEGRPGREPDWETAVHEAAHAVTAYALFGRAALGEVSIRVGRHRSRRYHTRGHFSMPDDWLGKNAPNSANWRDHATVNLAGAIAEELILGYRGHGADEDVGGATALILGLLDQGDPAFGPSRSTLEKSGGHPGQSAGSEAMRATAWHITRMRFAEDRTKDLVAGYRPSIERLARDLLRGSASGKAHLAGDEIVAAIDAAESVSESAGEAA